MEYELLNRPGRMGSVPVFRVFRVAESLFVLCTGQRVALPFVYVFNPIFLRSRRETFVSLHYYFA